jgi:mono/diheme cytochrome c family protein
MTPHGILLSVSPVASGGGGVTVGLVFGIQLVIAAALFGGFAWYVRGRRPGWSSAARIGAVLTGLAGAVLLLAAVLGPSAPGPAALVNPVPPTVTSVDAGQTLYEANCARCHGVDARGGGVDAGTTQVPPSNLRSGHLNAHSDADIYTWISDGLTGGMPAWSSKLSETDRWNLVNYLRSVDGRGPAPAPSAVVAPPALAGIGVGGTVAAALLGWLGVGLRRSRRPTSAVDALDPDDPADEEPGQTLR